MEFSVQVTSLVVYMFQFYHSKNDTSRVNVSSLKLHHVLSVFYYEHDKQSDGCTVFLGFQFDLVCDRSWLMAFSQSVFMAGQFVVIVHGFLADRLCTNTKNKHGDSTKMKR